MSELQFVPGTSGKPDYLVIARSKRCAVGVKPEFHGDVGKKFFVFGLRVRVCADPQQDFSEAPLTATEIAQTFAHVAFTNIDQTRGSFCIAQASKVEAGLTLKEGAFEYIGEAAVSLKFAAAIAKILKVDLVHDEKTVAGWMQEQWQERIAEFGTDPEALKKDVEQTVLNWFTNLGKPGAEPTA